MSTDSILENDEKLTRRVIVEKAGSFHFDWLPKGVSSLRLKPLRDLTVHEYLWIIKTMHNGDRMKILSEILTVYCGVYFECSPLVYNPETFEPMNKLYFNSSDGKRTIFRTCISPSLFAYDVTHHHGTPQFVELVEALVCELRTEIDRLKILKWNSRSVYLANESA
jgi:hypothetical protein